MIEGRYEVVPFSTRSSFKMKAFCSIWVLILIFTSCNQNSVASIVVNSKDSDIDSLFIDDWYLNEPIVNLSLTTPNATKDTAFDSLTMGAIRLKDGSQKYLTIIRPNKNLTIQVSADSTVRTEHVEDSLLTNLWKSDNEFFAENGNFIFSTQNLDSLRMVFNELRLQRREGILSKSAELKEEVESLLIYQNDSRFYSFLSFYGRIAKELPAKHDFYNFFEQLEVDHKWAKTSPLNLLYKYENEYLRKWDSISRIDSFLNYIEERTSRNDLANYLKSIYMKELIEQPDNWRKHQKLLDAKSLSSFMVRETNNPYRYLANTASNAFFATQEGEVAYDFKGELKNGQTFKLSDLKGKVVFIDNWASWCGPCIVQRPEVLKLAAKYRENPNIEFLMISVDSKKSDWTKFLDKEGMHAGYGTDLLIEDGMRSDYGKKYNIKFVPKYMLIDYNGKIVNSNLSEPSLVIEALINVELERIQN